MRIRSFAAISSIFAISLSVGFACVAEEDLDPIDLLDDEELEAAEAEAAEVEEVRKAGVADFKETGGLVSFEAEHFWKQTNTGPTKTKWYTFAAGKPTPKVQCVKKVKCSKANAPNCNQYPTCDGDKIKPTEAAGKSYVEALPDRRRTDHEPGTGNLGVINSPAKAPRLRYRVKFTKTGRYYVWARARGQGPAANGLHVGIDGTWPTNKLIDPSGMRLQFKSGWKWSQSRRGKKQHTGVKPGKGVSLRDANVWLDVKKPGVHIIELAMREDGLELDKIVMTTDPKFVPKGMGPKETKN